MDTRTPTDTPTPEKAPLVPIPRLGLPTVPSVILHILIALSAAMLPACAVGLIADPGESSALLLGIELAAAGLSLLQIAYLWCACRRARGLIPIVVVFGGLSYLVTASFIPLAAGLSLLFCVGMGSMLLAVSPRRTLVWFPLAMLGALAVSLAVTRDPLIALACLIPFPAALALAQGTRTAAAREDGPNRVGVICLTSLALGASIAAVAAALIYRALGTLDVTAILAKLDEGRAMLTEAMASLELSIPAPNGEEIPLDAEYAENLVNQAFNLLPALAVVTVNILAALAQMIQHASLAAFGFGDSVSDRVRLLAMSAVSGAVFILGYVTVWVSGTDASTLVGTVAENVVLILQPGLALCGMLRLIRSFMGRRNRGGCGCLVFFIVPVILFSAPVVLAFYEAISLTIGRLVSRLKPPQDPDSL